MSRAGQILWVNLTDGTTKTTPTTQYTNKYLGGNLVATRLFWENISPDVDALDPENMLTFNTGALTGTLLGTKCEVMTKSPLLTNSPLVSAGMGGQFPSEMKFAGYDHFVIQGKAEEPVYLYITNDAIQIRPAKHLWGLDTAETQDRIRKELDDPDVQIATIGVAGENLLAFSVIIHDIQQCASQGGVGAVMGSKNLKAVAVRGTKGIKIADPDKFYEIWNRNYDWYTNGNASWFLSTLNKEGLSWHYDLWEERNCMQWGYGPDAKMTYPPHKGHETGLQKITVDYSQNLGCNACPFQCQRNYNVPGVGTGGAACWTWLGFRTNIKTWDEELWYKSVRKCNLLGVHTVEASNMLGWLMELYDRKLISDETTDGVPMQFGSEKAVLTFLDKVATQDGFGKIFRDGIDRAVEILADGDEELEKEILAQTPSERNFLLWTRYFEPGTFPGGVGAMNFIKTVVQFIWMQPPVDRHAGFQLLAREWGIPREEALEIMERWLAKSAKRFSGDEKAWEPFAVEGKGKYWKGIETGVSMCDLTGHCDWQSDRVEHSGITWGLPEAAEAVSAATGEDWTLERTDDALRRKRLLESAYNMLCEILTGNPSDPTDAYLRMWEDPIPDGFFKGQAWDFNEKVGKEYCEAWRVDPENGIPIKEELIRLGLEDVAEKLDSMGIVGEAPKKMPAA